MGVRPSPFAPTRSIIHLFSRESAPGDHLPKVLSRNFADPLRGGYRFVRSAQCLSDVACLSRNIPVSIYTLPQKAIQKGACKCDRRREKQVGIYRDSASGA